MNREIEKLALKNHIVNKCLDWHRYSKGVTYQQALENMVILLVENNEALTNMLMEGWRKQ